MKRKKKFRSSSEEINSIWETKNKNNQNLLNIIQGRILPTQPRCKQVKKHPDVSAKLARCRPPDEKMYASFLPE
jgi:hypothetical protein